MNNVQGNVMMSYITEYMHGFGYTVYYFVYVVLSKMNKLVNKVFPV